MRWTILRGSFFSGLDAGQPSFARLCLSGALCDRYRSYFLTRVYPAGQCIHAQGEEITHFGLVTAGILKAVTCSATGEELCGSYFVEGDSFPELLYLTGNQRYTYLLCAEKKASVVWIPIEVLDEMLTRDPQLAGALLRYVSQRGLENQLYLNCMNYQTIRQRIAYWAVGIQRIEPGRAVRLPPSQTIFANLLHVSRPSLNQELKQMEREGYFRLESKKMCDVDTPRLSRLL